MVKVGEELMAVRTGEEPRQARNELLQVSLNSLWRDSSSDSIICLDLFPFDVSQ